MERRERERVVSYGIPRGGRRTAGSGTGCARPGERTRSSRGTVTGGAYARVAAAGVALAVFPARTAACPCGTQVATGSRKTRPRRKTKRVAARCVFVRFVFEPSIVGGNGVFVETPSPSPRASSGSSPGTERAFPARCTRGKTRYPADPPRFHQPIASSRRADARHVPGLCRGNSETHASARAPPPPEAADPKPHDARKTRRVRVRSSFPRVRAPRVVAAAALARRASRSHPPCGANIAAGTTFVSFSSFVALRKVVADRGGHSSRADRSRRRARCAPPPARVFLGRRARARPLVRQRHERVRLRGLRPRRVLVERDFLHPDGRAHERAPGVVAGLGVARRTRSGRARQGERRRRHRYARPPPGQLETCEGGGGP